MQNSTLSNNTSHSNSLHITHPGNTTLTANSRSGVLSPQPLQSKTTLGVSTLRVVFLSFYFSLSSATLNKTMDLHMLIHLNRYTFKI